LTPNEVSWLVVHRDKTTRQLMASYLCETYECVTDAAPEEVDQLLAKKSFDLMISPKVIAESPEEKKREITPGKLPAVAAMIQSGATGKRYELRLLNQDAASCIPNPFELVLLRALIERAELGFRILSIEKAPPEPST
jgi:DNA-binding NtrC family response regulator